MGWGSGAQVMQGIIKVLKEEIDNTEMRYVLYKKIVPVLQQNDWDTETDCYGLDIPFDVLLDELFPTEDL